MSPEHRECRQAFPVTPWSLVARAGDTNTEAMREALQTLLQRYLPALRAHLLHHRRLPPDVADDLLQSFVSRKVLEQRLIAKSDRERGRFRNFLLKALNNHVIDQLRRSRAAGEAARQLEHVCETELASEDEPSAAFDRAWAKQAVAEAVRRMRCECETSGRRDVWVVFEHRVLAPSLHNAVPTPYEQLVEQFDLRSPAQAANALVTAKRTFGRVLRGVFSESAEDDAEIEQDLRDLKRILSESPA